MTRLLTPSASIKRLLIMQPFRSRREVEITMPRNPLPSKTLAPDCFYAQVLGYQLHGTEIATHATGVTTGLDLAVGLAEPLRVNREFHLGLPIQGLSSLRHGQVPLP